MTGRPEYVSVFSLQHIAYRFLLGCACDVSEVGSWPKLRRGWMVEVTIVCEGCGVPRKGKRLAAAACAAWDGFCIRSSWPRRIGGRASGVNKIVNAVRRGLEVDEEVVPAHDDRPAVRVRITRAPSSGSSTVTTSVDSAVAGRGACGDGGRCLSREPGAACSVP
jgi:hypothetical protein